MSHDSNACSSLVGVSVLFFSSDRSEMKYLPSTPLRISGKLTTPAVRVGVSTGDGDIHAPVGYDIESYALASMTGAKVHNAHVAEFAGEGFSAGDIIGVWLVLPADPSQSNAAAQAERAREEREKEEGARKKKGRKKGGGGAAGKVAAEKEKDGAAMLVDSAAAAAAAAAAVKPAVSDAELVQNRKFHRHSFLRFYKNGVPLGGTPEQRAAGVGENAWSDKDVVRSTYFPAVSLYMGATVKLNFGPNFWCVPAEVARGVAFAQQRQLMHNAMGPETGVALPLATDSASPMASSQPAAAAAAAAAAPASSSLPPPALPAQPFRHPLSRPLLTSGLFPHLEGSGSVLQLNPKQAAANAAAAEEARQRGQTRSARRFACRRQTRPLLLCSSLTLCVSVRICSCFLFCSCVGGLSSGQSCGCHRAASSRDAAGYESNQRTSAIKSVSALIVICSTRFAIHSRSISNLHSLEEIQSSSSSFLRMHMRFAENNWFNLIV